ncbi:hypothetical protein BJ138DRAFT_1132366 [Hygrophoropsis aurantiaca]|uniref:Uncharacterized protein n=1 Tax=Hygrophoropsis aurantiaca TaxID=72124 RepID=A0ACB8ARY3_9AGAM|nr:hypothetical protein BJ138DRAFT_1132366 [Hygrophoropsis aurantiaca]
MPYIKAHYHPFLFVLITICAMAELGLAAFLISAGNESHSWPSVPYHAVLILIEFSAVWTTIFGTAYMLWIVDGAIHFLASIASSILWLVITTALWGSAAGMLHTARPGGDCNWIPDSITSGFVDESLPCDTPEELSSTSRCRETLTIEILAWIEFGLCAVTILATCLWLRTSKRSYRSSFYV